MIESAVTLAIAMTLVGMLLSTYRLLRGPDAPDRILALDTLYINAIALIILMCIRLGSSLYFEAALLIAVMGFVGTISLAKFLTRGDIIE